MLAILEGLLICCSGFVHLDSISKKRLIDSLCSNLSVLGVSVNSLLIIEGGEEKTESASAHCSALKAYTFLLWWICSQSEQQARNSENRQTAPSR